MGSKRVAAFQMTKDNYDLSGDESDGESGDGVSKLANEETLKARKILVPKRRLGATASDNGEPKSVFAGFKGFATSTNTADAFKGFSFLSTTPSPMVTNKPPVDLVKTNQEQKSLLVPTIPSLNNSGNDSKHLADVQMLNKTFYDHLTKYMGGQDKIYDYTVVCEEYIRYMSQLNASKTSPRLVSSTSSETGQLNNSVEKSKYTFSSLGETTKASAPITAPKTSLFSFGTTSTSAPGGDSGGFAPKFNSFTPSSKPGALFQNPCPVSNNGPPQQQEDEEAADEAPPKVESIEHKEDNAVFTKKCKLYFQKDGQFVDKGTGFLYIKVVPEEGRKPQLLIRADTSMGNILLNIALVGTLPIVKVEKKGVMITCISNPKKADEDGESTTFLIRVKQVDELYDALNEHKTK